MTSSLLTLVINTSLITASNLKIKCVVSSLNLYHQSNEVSVETVGLKPETEPSVKLLYSFDPKNVENGVTTEMPQNTRDSGGPYFASDAFEVRFTHAWLLFSSVHIILTMCTKVFL